MTASIDGGEEGRKRRWDRKRQRLDAPSSVCEGCAARFVAALYQAFFPDNPTGLRRRSIEHHPAGRRVDRRFIVPECSYHADVLDDLRNDWDMRLLNPSTPLEEDLAVIWGIADLLEVRGRTDCEIAQRLRRVVLEELGNDVTMEDPPCEK